MLQGIKDFIYDVISVNCLLDIKYDIDITHKDMVRLGILSPCTRCSILYNLREEVYEDCLPNTKEILLHRVHQLTGGKYDYR